MNVIPSPQIETVQSEAPAKATVQKLVNGNQAVAFAALVAGVDYFSHYPGSPVNLIEPTIKKLAKAHDCDIYVNDALNEHVAALAAAGASYCGARSLVVMKHVGMNIAADPFNYLGYTGIRGGMVIVVGTDPGANCSTGEEDTHWYIPQINFPLFEPTSVKDAYAQVLEGYRISERYQIPVVLFMPTRICYSHDFVDLPPIPPRPRKTDFYFEKNKEKYINVGKKTVNNHRLLLEKIDLLSRQERQLKTFFNPAAAIGIVTRGITFGHSYEAVERLGIGQDVHLLNLDMVFPLQESRVLEFSRGKQELVFIEDQDGFLESQTKMQLFNDVDCGISGKSHFPKYGEIQYGQVYEYLATRFGIAAAESSTRGSHIEVPERLGAFCEGCPHRASYYAIDRAMDGRDGVIGGDIGCSSLPPFRADWLLCMNAGIGIAQGMAQVLSKQPVISTGGDASFFHAGLLSLMSAVHNKIDLLHIVFDNRSIAMTGHQDSPTTRSYIDHRALLKSIGVNRIIDVSAKKPSAFAKQLRRELDKTGVRVMWVSGNCAHMAGGIEQLIRKTRVVRIEHDRCGTCTDCYDKLACPAIYSNPETKKLMIDETRCARCGACIDICGKNALRTSFQVSGKTAFLHALDYVKDRMTL